MRFLSVGWVLSNALCLVRVPRKKTAVVLCKDQYSQIVLTFIKWLQFKTLLPCRWTTYTSHTNFFYFFLRVFTFFPGLKKSLHSLLTFWLASNETLFSRIPNFSETTVENFQKCRFFVEKMYYHHSTNYGIPLYSQTCNLHLLRHNQVFSISRNDKRKFSRNDKVLKLCILRSVS